MGGFFSALFGGQNKNLNTDIGATGQIAGFATGLGESNVTAGSDFMKSILSGDSSKISQALAPTISAAKTSAQQQNKTNSIFGTRSGGTAAEAASTDDRTHATITDLIGNLTGSSASNLLSSGSSLLSQGESAYGDNAKLSQQQMENWSNSILGKSITGAVSAAESAGIGAGVGALPGGGGAGAGAASALGIGGGGFGGGSAYGYGPLSNLGYGSNGVLTLGGVGQQ